MQSSNALAAFATQVVAGAALFYGMVKVFDTLEDRINEDTRLAIAVWLLGLEKYNFHPRVRVRLAGLFRSTAVVVGGFSLR